MPSLNDTPVQLNDILYDISNGQGTVVSLTNDTIEVKFRNGRRITFNQYGQIDGIRRLFWQYPIIIDPPKSMDKWKKFVDIIIAVHKLTSE